MHIYIPVVFQTKDQQWTIIQQRAPTFKVGKPPSPYQFYFFLTLYNHKIKLYIHQNIIRVRDDNIFVI